MGVLVGVPVLGGVMVAECDWVIMRDGVDDGDRVLLGDAVSVSVDDGVEVLVKEEVGEVEADGLLDEVAVLESEGEGEGVDEAEADPDFEGVFEGVIECVGLLVPETEIVREGEGV